MPSKPKWNHSCSQCRYLGSVSLRGGSLLSAHYDLYVHTADVEKSYLARYGNDGPDYVSLPESAFSVFLKGTTLGEVGSKELALVLARIQDRDRNAPIPRPDGNGWYRRGVHWEREVEDPKHPCAYCGCTTFVESTHSWTYCVQCKAS